MVATNDVRFISSEDFDAHEIRVAIHDGYTLADPKRPKLYSPQQYLRSEDEMCELFADIPKHCRTASKLLSVVTSLSASASIFCRSSRPGYEHGRLSGQTLERGIGGAPAFLFPDPEVRAQRRPEYDERLDVELKVINQMGFPLLPDRDGVYPVVEG